MGYNLYITRRTYWFDEDGPEIREDEWRAVVTSDPALFFSEDRGDRCARWSGPSAHEDPWITWWEGNLESKNPDPPLIRKMHAIALRLDARLMGEEGELYGADGAQLQVPLTDANKPPPQPWWEPFLRRFRKSAPANELPFSVGDRVRDALGRVALVTGIDRQAEHGLGRITVQLENGSELTVSAVAHGFELLSGKSPGDAG